MSQMNPPNIVKRHFFISRLNIILLRTLECLPNEVLRITFYENFSCHIHAVIVHLNLFDNIFSFVYCTEQMHIISYVSVLNTQLPHVSVQAHRLQGAQYPRFKTSCQR
jgi:hypothetical protein